MIPGIGAVVLLLTAMVVAGGASVVTNEVYFVPTISNASYGTVTDVEVWVNATNFQSGQMTITYDPCCADVTSWVRDEPNFAFGAWNTSDAGSERIAFVGTSLKSGGYRIGTLRIRGVNDSERGCATPLTFVTCGDDSLLVNDYGESLTEVAWLDGGFDCSAATVCGDVNCDATINMGDVTLLLNHWSNSAAFPVCSDWAADVNCDGTVNVGDVTLLSNHWADPASYPLRCC
jgi:hypothetical protein